MSSLLQQPLFWQSQCQPGLQLSHLSNRLTSQLLQHDGRIQVSAVSQVTGQHSEAMDPEEIQPVGVTSYTEVMPDVTTPVKLAPLGCFPMQCSLNTRAAPHQQTQPHPSAAAF